MAEDSLFPVAARDDVKPLSRPLSVWFATEIRDDLARAPARQIAGALYVSCSGRGGPHFGAPNAELQAVLGVLGETPLAGFFAGGESPATILTVTREC